MTMTKKLLIKYHSIDMLTTLDLCAVFTVLRDVFGLDFVVSFQPMNAMERDSVSSANIPGVMQIKERFWLFEESDGAEARRPELESAIVRAGNK